MTDEDMGLRVLKTCQEPGVPPGFEVFLKKKNESGYPRGHRPGRGDPVQTRIHAATGQVGVILPKHAFTHLQANRVITAVRVKTRSSYHFSIATSAPSTPHISATRLTLFQSQPVRRRYMSSPRKNTPITAYVAATSHSIPALFQYATANARTVPRINSSEANSSCTAVFSRSSCNAQMVQ